MDYCSTCRRHLNGALVCPGCGAYAPDIAPSVIGGHTVPGAASAAAGPAEAVSAPDPRSADAASPQSAPSVTGTGRAARRRQQTRWRKTQRRALVATAVALVGGGLTVASMDRGSGDRAQAATAPDHRGLGGATGPADGTTDPGSTPASPDRTPPSAGDDEQRRDRTGGTQASPAPSRTHTDSATEGRTEVTPGPRTTAPESVSRSGARAEARGNAGADAGADTGSGSASASGSGSATTPPTTPPPAADDGDASGGSDRGESTQPAPTTPPAGETDSDRLCLLVLCVG